MESFLSQTEFDQVTVVAEAESSNDLALAADPADGAWQLFVAERQTAGRGRRENTWWSAEGALTFSVLIDTKAVGVAPDAWPMVPLATGLAVHRAVQAVLPTCCVTVKWPNDVYVDGLKVAGILVEQSPRKLDSLVVGIGINVNSDMKQAPAEVRECATSVATAGKQSCDMENLLLAVIENLRDTIGLLDGQKHALVTALNRVSYLSGRQVQIDQGAEGLVGCCQGIAASGALLVQTESGIRECMAGTVTLR